MFKMVTLLGDVYTTNNILKFIIYTYGLRKAVMMHHTDFHRLFMSVYIARNYIHYFHGLEVNNSMSRQRDIDRKIMKYSSGMTQM